MSLLTPEVGLLFWMTLSFVIALAVLARWGFPAIARMVDERTKHIEQSLEAADEARRKLETVESQSNEMMEKAQKEYAETVQKALGERAAIIERSRDEAAEAARAKIGEAERAIAARREEALREMGDAAAALGVEIAGKILRRQLDRSQAQMDMINKLLDEVSAKADSNRKQ